MTDLGRGSSGSPRSGYKRERGDIREKRSPGRFERRSPPPPPRDRSPPRRQSFESRDRSPPRKKRRDEFDRNFDRRRESPRRRSIGDEGGLGRKRHSPSPRRKISRDFGGRDAQRYDGPLQSFKLFLSHQSDRPSYLVGMRRYEEYKQEYDKRNMRLFFKQHQESQWFREKYYPPLLVERLKEESVLAQKEAEQFLEDLKTGTLPFPNWDADENEELLKVPNIPEPFQDPPESGEVINHKKSLIPKEEDVVMNDVIEEIIQKKEETDEHVTAHGNSEEIPQKKEIQEEEHVYKPKEPREVNDDKMPPEDGKEDTNKEEGKETTNKTDVEEVKMEEAKVETKADVGEDKVDKAKVGEANVDKAKVGEEKVGSPKEEGTKDETVKEKNDDQNKSRDDTEEDENNAKPKTALLKPRKPTTLEPPSDQKTLLISDIPFTCPYQSLLFALNQVSSGHVVELLIGNPKPRKQFTRRGWVTYSSKEASQEALTKLNGTEVPDCNLHLSPHTPCYEPLTPRLTPIDASTPARIRKDLEQIRKLTRLLDDSKGIEKNLLLGRISVQVGKPTKPSVSDGNLTKPSVSDGNLTKPSVSDGILTKPSGSDGNETKPTVSDGNGSDQVVTDEKNVDTVLVNLEDRIIQNSSDRELLDLFITYLRRVHWYCYYTSESYPSYAHLKVQAGVVLRGTNKYNSPEDGLSWAQSLDTALREKLSAIPNRKKEITGQTQTEKLLNSFYADKIYKEADDRWRCELCAKMFKAANFVKKHFHAKHSDHITALKQKAIELQFYNNFISDPHHILPSMQYKPKKDTQKNSVGGRRNDRRRPSHEYSPRREGRGGDRWGGDRGGGGGGGESRDLWRSGGWSGGRGMRGRRSGDIGSRFFRGYGPRSRGDLREKQVELLPPPEFKDKVDPRSPITYIDLDKPPDDTFEIDYEKALAAFAAGDQ